METGTATLLAEAEAQVEELRRRRAEELAEAAQVERAAVLAQLHPDWAAACESYTEAKTALLDVLAKLPDLIDGCDAARVGMEQVVRRYKDVGLTPPTTRPMPMHFTPDTAKVLREARDALRNTGL